MVANFVEKNDILISIDLRKGFHHLQLQPGERKYLCFCWRSHIFQWCVLLFGVKSAPYLFSKIVKQVVNYFREKQSCCSVWVNDFIFMISPETNFEFHCDWILSVFARLGWTVNFDKCDLDPSPQTTCVPTTAAENASDISRLPSC